MSKAVRSIIKKMESYPRFYRRVWLECAKIPRGKTRSYKDIARAVGNPRASRAVAGALGANPFAPVIPCHRVVCSDGKVGGYSGGGGIRKKISLLAAEGVRIRRGKVAAVTRFAVGGKK